MTSKTKVSLMALFTAVSLGLYNAKSMYFSPDESLAAEVVTVTDTIVSAGVLSLTFTLGQDISAGGSIDFTIPILSPSFGGYSITCPTFSFADGNPQGSFVPPGATSFTASALYTSAKAGTYHCTFSGFSLASSGDVTVGLASGLWKGKRAIGTSGSEISSSSPATSSPESPSGFTDPLSASISNLAAKATGVTATFKFTTTNAFGIPSSGKVEYTFPSGFILPSSTADLKTACAGATKLGVLSISGQKITLKKTETNATPPVTLTCQFSGITNPSSEGTTGNFTFTIVDSTGVIKLETKTDVPGVTITAAKTEAAATTSSTETTQQQTSTEQKSTDTTLHSAPEAEDPLAKKKATDKEAKIKRLAELEKKLSENVPEEVKEKLGTAVKTMKVKEKQLSIDDDEVEESSITEGLIDEELFEADYTALGVKELKSEKRKLSIEKKNVMKAFKEQTLAAVDEEEKQDLQVQLKAILKQFKTAQKDLDKETKKKKKTEKAAKKKKK